MTQTLHCSHNGHNHSARNDDVLLMRKLHCSHRSCPHEAVAWSHNHRTHAAGHTATTLLTQQMMCSHVNHPAHDSTHRAHIAVLLLTQQLRCAHSSHFAHTTATLLTEAALLAPQLPCTPQLLLLTH